MSDLKCLENIIGLSRTECPCFDEGKPLDADVSKSGYYLDELKSLDLKLIGSDVECGESDVWTKMQKSVEIAKNTFKTDVLSSLMRYASTKRKMYNGTIGETKNRAVRMIDNNFAGIVIQGCDIRGGQFTLKSISTIMDSDATFDVFVYNNIQDDPLLSIQNIESEANTIKKNVLANDDSLTFPLYSDECDNLEYYIVYVPSGFNPRDNKISCGCSRRQSFEQWFQLQGITGDNVSTLELREYMPRNEFANGLLLEMVISCATEDLICGGDNEDRDYDNDPVSRVIAASIQFKAGEVLLNDILSSGNINRYTMMSKESLYGNRNHYAAEYGQRIQWLSENMSITGNDCLGCSDDRISRSAILS